MLHIEWSPHTAQHGNLLAVATSTGSVLFYRLNHEGEDCMLVHVGSKQICDESILVLYLTWHPRRPDILGVTLSDGRVCLCELSGPEELHDFANIRVQDIAQHSLEAWYLALHDDGDTTSVFSGGDDLLLQLTARRNEQDVHTVWQDRRLHQAGVTAILPLTSELLATGSYDDHIRLVATPTAGRRQVLAEANLGGGVWRLRVLDVGLSDTARALAPVQDSTAQSARTRYVLHMLRYRRALRSRTPAYLPA
jgi:diphthine methyl ester acylhydrolase